MKSIDVANQWIMKRFPRIKSLAYSGGIREGDDRRFGPSIVGRLLPLFQTTNPIFD
jgi:hypothetical protein